MSFEIEKVAELARIRLTPDEKNKLQSDLGAILGYVEKLKSVDTSKVSETSHVMDLTNVFREDKVLPSDVSAAVLRAAPDRDGKFFRVPKTVER